MTIFICLYDYYDSPIYRDGIDYSGYLYEIDNY